MSGRAAGWSAWGLWALTALAVVPTLLLASSNGPSSARNTAIVSVLILAFSTVGALIASRRPENPIGWLFCSGASLWIFGELALEYAVYALVSAPGSLPAGAWAGWSGGWARGAGWFLVVVFFLLLFPTGRLPGRRWRPVLWGIIGFFVFFTLVVWLSPASSDLRLAFLRNPMGLDLAVMSFLLEVVYLAMPLLPAVGGAAVVVRFRRAGGEERQQIKWFAYAAIVMVVLFSCWFSLALAGLASPDALMWTVPLLGFPLAVGVAILRHRLLDIDLVINRTLVYAVLTAMLALVYLGGVASLQYVFRVLGGGESSLAVVASTLLIAALFSPLRRRIQRFIDRRFYRERYDARKTLEVFTVRLRDGADLGALSGELVSVVRKTMRPAHASLWLREPGASAQRTGRRTWRGGP
jgi:hypothetical protein